VLPVQPDPASAIRRTRVPADPRCRGRPLPHPVDGQQRCVLVVEGAREEGAGGMCDMVIDEHDPAGIDSQLPLDVRLDPEFLVEPVDHGLGEALPRHREGCQGGCEYPLELHERFFVEDHAVEIRGLDPGAGETERDRPAGEPFVVLDPAEALLLRRGDQPSVREEGGCGIVIVAAQSKDVHDWPLSTA